MPVPSRDPKATRLILTLLIVLVPFVLVVGFSGYQFATHADVGSGLLAIGAALLGALLILRILAAAGHMHKAADGHWRFGRAP